MGKSFQAAIPKKEVPNPLKEAQITENLDRLNNFFTKTYQNQDTSVRILKYHPFYDILRRSTPEGEVFHLYFERDFRKVDCVSLSAFNSRFLTICAYINQFLTEREIEAIKIADLKRFYEQTCKMNMANLVCSILNLDDDFQEFLNYL